MMSPRLHSSTRKGRTITAIKREIRLREGKVGSFVQVVSKGSIRLNKDEINLCDLAGLVSRSVLGPLYILCKGLILKVCLGRKTSSYAG